MGSESMEKVETETRSGRLVISMENIVRCCPGQGSASGILGKGPMRKADI
jgi:hypothetical protein